METVYKPCAGILRFINSAKGWGVVSDRAITADRIVEIAPVLILFRAITDQHLNLKTRVFDWGALGGRPGETALALGYGSIYNHGNPPNLRYRAIPRGISSGLEFSAAREIAAGEELTVNYNGAKGDIVSTSDNWFETNQITPVA
jgi:hypothetical protein